MAGKIDEAVAKMSRELDGIESGITERIASTQYLRLQSAFDILNRELFGSKLPSVMFTLQRKANCDGYFCEGRFEIAADTRKKVRRTAHEIALNPEHFRTKGHEGVFATLLHQMCHLHQCEFGERKPRSGYHDKEWGKAMLDRGLVPVCSDSSRRSSSPRGGIPTGQTMSHKVVDGPLRNVASKFLKDRGPLIIVDQGEKAAARSSESHKVKQTCGCGKSIAWAKDSSNILCGHCGTRLMPNGLDAEGWTSGPAGVD